MKISIDKKTIFLERDEVKRLCKPGAGADTCICLVVGSEGFECTFYNQEVPNLEGETLHHRWERGATVAKRNGCDEVKRLLIEVTNPS